MKNHISDFLRFLGLEIWSFLYSKLVKVFMNSLNKNLKNRKIVPRSVNIFHENGINSEGGGGLHIRSSEGKILPFVTFARSLDVYSFRLFAKSCKINF